MPTGSGRADHLVPGLFQQRFLNPSQQYQVDPLGAQGGDNFVIRGASWGHSKIAELRLSYRDYGQAGRDDVGFRIARFAE